VICSSRTTRFQLALLLLRSRCGKSHRLRMRSGGFFCRANSKVAKPDGHPSQGPRLSEFFFVESTLLIRRTQLCVTTLWHGTPPAPDYGPAAYRDWMCSAEFLSQRATREALLWKALALIGVYNLNLNPTQHTAAAQWGSESPGPQVHLRLLSACHVGRGLRVGASSVAVRHHACTPVLVARDSESEPRRRAPRWNRLGPRPLELGGGKAILLAGT
jgi:hypothetical protein